MEFFSTVSFEANTVDPYYVHALVFHLGGQYRESSLAEFAWRMVLYEQRETMSPMFERILPSSARDFYQGISGYEFWKTITNGEFHSKVSHESQIRSSIHRFIHRLVMF